MMKLKRLRSRSSLIYCRGSKNLCCRKRLGINCNQLMRFSQINKWTLPISINLILRNSITSEASKVLHLNLAIFLILTVPTAKMTVMTKTKSFGNSETTKDRVPNSAEVNRLTVIKSILKFSRIILRGEIIMILSQLGSVGNMIKTKTHMECNQSELIVLRRKALQIHRARSLPILKIHSSNRWINHLKAAALLTGFQKCQSNNLPAQILKLHFLNFQITWTKEMATKTCETALQYKDNRSTKAVFLAACNRRRWARRETS